MTDLMSTQFRPAPLVSGPDRFFRTDHLTTDLKGRSVRGGVVTLGSQGLKFVLNVGSTMVLARLLTPGDFGLVAMVAPVTGFISLFKDLGLSMATVQRHEINHGQVSTLFWINVAASLLLMAIAIVLAPAVGWFYSDPRATWITVVFAFTFIFGGLTAQHQALITRQMRFTSLAAIELTALLVSIAAGILAALAGLGYWALVLMLVVSAATNAVMVWLISPWRPGKLARGSGVRQMLAFGGNATAASVLNYLGRNLDKVLIGRWLGPLPLGFYDQAHRLIKLPITQLNAPLGSVAVPALCRALGEQQRYRRAFLTTMQRIMLITGPAIAFAIMCSDWLIRITLGPQWGEAAAIFSILAAGAILLPVTNGTSWLFISQNRMREHLYWQMAVNPLRILLIVVGLPWGLIGVSVAVASGSYLLAPFLFWLIGRQGPIRASDFYRMLALPAFTVFLVLLLLAILRRTLLVDPHPLSGAAIGLGAAALATLGCLVATATGRRVIRSSINDLKDLHLARERRDA